MRDHAGKESACTVFGCWYQCLMSSTVHRTVNSPSFNVCGHPCLFLFTQTATNLGRKLSQAGVKVDHNGSLDIDSDPKQQLELIQVL